MQREILFKAIRKDGKGWVEGDYLSKMNPALIMNYGNGYANNYDEIEVDPETVCQYTNEKDKIGENIFEGDFVMYNGWQWVVYFQSGCFYIRCRDNYYTTIRFDEIAFTTLHVIGNIHDKKEVAV